MRFHFVAGVSALASLLLNPLGVKAQQPAASSSPLTCKVCVSQPKETIRKVYAAKTEEYCLPRCGLLPLLGGGCGCAGEVCGDLKARHRLIVKKVPGHDTIQCVPHEAPMPFPTRPPLPGHVLPRP